MKLSIVTTLYKSSLYADEFYERITSEANKIIDDHEILFVDDGSPDDSLKKAISLPQKDRKVKVSYEEDFLMVEQLLHARGLTALGKDIKYYAPHDQNL